MDNLEPVQFRPVLQILVIITDLRLYRMLPALVHRRIYRVEDAADQDRPPYQLSTVAARHVLDPAESEIGPRTGAIVKKFEFPGHPVPSAAHLLGARQCKA